MSSSLPPPILVDTPEGLARLGRELSEKAAIAVDTEADSFFSYREKVCLVQISVDETDYIVDPLAPLDLRELGALFASTDVRKVLHDAEYDVALLKAAGVGEVRNVFDTRLASSLLGSKTPGLSNVLRDRYGIALDKSMQRSDWRRRPLTEEQLRYARHDTRHLLRLARDTEGEIAARGLGEVFRFECERLAATEPRARVFEAEECLGYRGSRELDRDGLSALRELAIERDRVAREADEAPFRVIASELLVLIAKLRPRDRRELDGVRALPPRIRARFGAAALAALVRARDAGPWTPPRRVSTRTDEEIELGEKLRRWRTKKAAELKLDASAVLNRKTMEEIVKRRPRTIEELAEMPGIAPWQIERYGEEVLGVVAG